MTTIIVIAAVAVVAVVIGIYNSLVRLRNTSEQAWSDVDVQLKRRHDLVPNLVETVKGYASHERKTLEEVIKARNMAVSPGSPEEQAKNENFLQSALKNLFALAENYPDLKANQNFINLQNQLSEIEEKIQMARRYYNAVVRDLNTKIESVPSNIIADMFGFSKREYFELETPGERAVPEVNFQ